MSNFNIDMPIVHQITELVMLHDISWDDANWDLHVCIVPRLHGHAQIKVLEVPHHASCIGCGNDTVEQQFCSNQVSCLGADIAIILYTITSHSPSDTVQDFLFWSVSTNNVHIHCFLVSGDGRHGDEKHGVGSWGVAMTLRQLVDFGGIGCLPQQSIRTIAELFVLCKFTHIWIEGIAMQGSIWCWFRLSIGQVGSMAWGAAWFCHCSCDPLWDR